MCVYDHGLIPGYWAIAKSRPRHKAKKNCWILFYTFQEYSSPPRNRASAPRRDALKGIFFWFFDRFWLTQFGNIFIPKGYVVTTERALSGPFITVCVLLAFFSNSACCEAPIRDQEKVETVLPDYLPYASAGCAGTTRLL
jgi:hypothetical protein